MKPSLSRIAARLPRHRPLLLTGPAARWWLEMGGLPCSAAWWSAGPIQWLLPFVTCAPLSCAAACMTPCLSLMSVSSPCHRPLVLLGSTARWWPKLGGLPCSATCDWLQCCLEVDVALSFLCFPFLFLLASRWWPQLRFVTCLESLCKLGTCTAAWLLHTCLGRRIACQTYLTRLVLLRLLCCCVMLCPCCVLRLCPWLSIRVRPPGVV